MDCIIIDDNQMARAALNQLASKVGDLSVAGECANAMEAYNLIQKKGADILFLDIEMPEMNGLELTRHLGSKKPIIIFTTSKKEYALDAFDLNVADYIVKPITPSRFLQAVEKAREIYKSQKMQVAIEEKEFIFIRDNGVLLRLAIDEILFLEAMGDYVKVFTKARFHAIHTTLKKIEETLPASKLLRVHRSYIVALNKIDKIQDGVIIINSKPVPVADAYRNSLNKRLNIV